MNVSGRRRKIRKTLLRIIEGAYASLSFRDNGKEAERLTTLFRAKIREECNIKQLQHFQVDV